MSTPAGPGADTLRICLLLSLLALGASGLQAAEVADDGWVDIGAFEVAGASRRVLLLQQTGPDLYVRTTRPDGTAEVQDGHDSRFGTEVIVLDNPGSAPLLFELAVKARYSAMTPAYQLLEPELRDPAEQQIATQLAQAARLALTEPLGDTRLATLWATVSSQHRTSPLHDIVLLQHVQALLQNSAYSELALLLEGLADRDGFNTETVIYLGWVEAVAHWQLRNTGRALAGFEALAPLLQEYPPSSVGRFLDRQQLQAHWGATLIIDGLRAGDQARMRAGAARIDEALSLAAEYPDYRLLGDMHNFVSGYSNMLSNRVDEGGIKALDLAEYYFTLADDKGSLATIKNNKAFTLLGKGQVGEAQRLYREAIQITRQLNDTYWYSFYLARLAATYLRTGDLSRAEALYRESTDLLAANGFEKEVTVNEIELGLIYRLQERHADAIELYEDLLARIAADISVEESMRIHTELGRNLLAIGETARADEHATFATDLIPRVNRLDYRLEAILLQASIDTADGNHAAAIEQILATFTELADASQESLQQLELYLLLSRNYFASGQFQQALETGRQTIAIISSIRNQLDIGWQGPNWSARTETIISQHIDHLLVLHEASGEQQYLDEAFANIQNSRALSLRQARSLSPGNRGISAAGSSEQLAALWEAMNIANRNLLAASIQGQPLETLQQELLARQEAYRRFEATVTPTQLDAVPDTLTISAIQRQLDTDTLALSFHLGEQASWRIMISRDRVEAKRFASAAVINDISKAFIAAVADRNRSLGNDFRELSDFLFPEMPEQSINPRLVLELDGSLAGLPLAAVPVGPAPAGGVAVDDFTLLSTIALSSYFAGETTASVNAASGSPIAIFADPVFDENFAVAAAEVGLEDFRGWRGGLQPLPFTRIEANSITSMFGEQDSLLYVGNAATISNLFLPASRAADILHIATHGFADTSDASLSGLAFSPDTGNPAGLLTAEEIARYSFSNQLIVISGCETGQGQMLEGEGLMSIGRAFLAQGAKAVVATLWPVSDRATATFMNSFYAALLEHRDPALALRTAQNQLRESGQFRHPYYWSGFVLTVAES